jgi:predicted aspartyl protease
MFNTAKVILCGMMLVLSNLLSAQQIRYIDGIKSSVVIPFEYHNNFIVINIRLNGFPLKFIVDTGAEHSILFKKEIADIMGIEYGRRVRIMGADLNSELYAHILPFSTIVLEDKCVINTQILVLEEDFIELDKIIGINIYGVIGSNILKNFVVKIDYTKLQITLIPQQKFRPPSKFEVLPMPVDRTKPYLDVGLKLPNRSPTSARLLLDTGASLSGLLYATERNEIEIPDTIITGVLGAGLGGSLRGYMGKLELLAFGTYRFENILTSYQRIEGVDSLLVMRNKDGILGNAILSRFTLYLDYQNEQLYMKPNRSYRKKLRYDRSGMVLITSGERFQEFVVLDVIQGSPADDAGVKPGYRLLSLNGFPVRLLTFDRINKRLSGRIGKQVKLKFKDPDGTEIPLKFRLRELL